MRHVIQFEDFTIRLANSDQFVSLAEEPEYDIQYQCNYYADYDAGHQREIERVAGSFDPNISREISEQQS